jgi:chromosome segregation ATPase
MAKNGKTPKSKPVDTGRETRVLLENMNRNITRIAEAQSSTTEQIADIKANMATKSELETVSMAVMSLSGDVKTLKNDVKNIDTRLKTVEEKIGRNLDNHDKRIAKLEEKVLV